MKRMFRIKEIQIGLVILVVTFISLLLSDSIINLDFVHGLIIIVSAVLLIIFMLQVTTILVIPDQNRVQKMKKSHKYMMTIKMIFFFIYFAIITLIVSLIGEAIGERSYNILIISMFMTNLYNLLLSTMIIFNLIRLSEKKDDL